MVTYIPRERFTRLRRELEPRWAAEYVVKHYPQQPARYRCPLGPIPKALTEEMGVEKAAKVYRPWRPEVDAVVVFPDKAILIEAKIFRWYDGIAKLKMYDVLFRQTPELQAWWAVPTELQLLVPKIFSPVQAAAETYGVKLIEWAPDYIMQAWMEKQTYWTREAVEIRERRKEILERLGAP